MPERDANQPAKPPCLHPLPDGRRCLECETCQGQAVLPAQSTETRWSERDANQPEGWGFTGSSTKAHYFRDGTSLCRKWGFRRADAPHEPDTGPSPDDCVACRRELDKEASRA